MERFNVLYTGADIKPVDGELTPKAASIAVEAEGITQALQVVEQRFADLPMFTIINIARVDNSGRLKY